MSKRTVAAKAEVVREPVSAEIPQSDEEQLRWLLRVELERMNVPPGGRPLSDASRRQGIDSITRLRKQIADLHKGDEVTEAQILKLGAFRALTDRVLAALRPYPEACRAVMAALASSMLACGGAPGLQQGWVEGDPSAKPVATSPAPTTSATAPAPTSAPTAPAPTATTAPSGPEAGVPRRQDAGVATHDAANAPGPDAGAPLHEVDAGPPPAPRVECYVDAAPTNGDPGGPHVWDCLHSLWVYYRGEDGGFAQCGEGNGPVVPTVACPVGVACSVTQGTGVCQ